MNIPVGTVEAEHLSFAETDPFRKAKQLMQSGFSGYLVANAEGFSGMEEGLLMFKESQVVGAVFDALRLNKQVYGVPALRLALGLLKVPKGIFDLNRLSRQQIDLIIAFNEKIRLPKPVDLAMLSKLEPKSYSPELVSQGLSMEADSSDAKAKLLKKLGLGSI